MAGNTFKTAYVKTNAYTSVCWMAKLLLALRIQVTLSSWLAPLLSLSLSAQRISNCLSCKSADQLLFSSFPAEEQESDTAILRSRTSLEHVPDFLRSSEEQILGSCVVVLSLLTHGVQKSGADSHVTSNVTVLYCA